jgi:exosortase
MAVAAPTTERRLVPPAGWPLYLGLAVLAIPTMFRLAAQDWSQEFGAYGPIVLGTGGWLLWREIPQFKRDGVPGAAWLTVVVLVVSLAFYVFGRAYDFLTFETAGVYGVGLAMLHDKIGLGLMRKNWFPLLYLAFVVPPPNSLLLSATAPLKQLVSLVATDTLHVIGLPVAREGVTIFVAQYQLLVEDACAGMNSIVGLIAVSLLYIYLLRGSSLIYSLCLTVFVIPVAIVANILRIMTLILLTYFFGDAVGQGFLHFAAGMFLFTTALLLVFGVDNLIFLVRKRLETKA